MNRLPDSVSRRLQQHQRKMAVALAGDWLGQSATPMDPARRASAWVDPPGGASASIDAASDLLPARFQDVLSGFAATNLAVAGVAGLHGHRPEQAWEHLERNFAPPEIRKALESGRRVAMEGPQGSGFASMLTAVAGGGGSLIGQMGKGARVKGDGPQLSALLQNAGPLLSASGPLFASFLSASGSEGPGKSGLPSVLSCFGKSGAESGGLSGLLSSVGTMKGLSGLMSGLANFLPPQAKMGLGVAMALASGDPMQILGSLAGFLPPELQKAAGAAMPLLKGDLMGSLNALVGQYLPPELQGVWATFQGMGGVEGLLGVQLPQIPSPFGEMPPVAAPEEPPDAEGAEQGAGAPHAARVGDPVVCKKGGGPISTGQKDVLIGGSPAARVSDLAVCIGPPDVIVEGEDSVLVGGMPAARHLDRTAHSGNITKGFPTVLIGKSALLNVKCMAGKGTSLIKPA